MSSFHFISFSAVYYWLTCKNWVCFELIYVNHETRSSMKLTGGGNMYDHSTRNWHYTNVQWYKLDAVKNLKLHFKMLQRICFDSLHKECNNMHCYFPSQNELLMRVYVKYIFTKLTFELISHIIKPFIGKLSN